MRCIRSTALCSLIVMFGACESAPSIATAPLFDAESAASGPSANGHSEWINRFGEDVSRSFYARTMPDLTVTGEFVQHVTALNGDRRKNQSEIDCMHFLAPNDVMLSGIVKENVNPIFIGQTQVFRVVDNGEGADDAGVDQQSGVIFMPTAPGVNCRTVPPPAVTPIVAGNIQVRP